MKILIAIPSAGSIRNEVVSTLLNIIASPEVTRHQANIFISEARPTDYNMNIICAKAIECSDWLLTMDSDNPPLKNPLELIAKLNLEENPERIGVVTLPTPIWHGELSRKTGFIWNVFDEGGRPLTKPEGVEYQDVDTTGAGCLLINTQMLREMKRPWFKYVQNYDEALPKMAQGHDFYFSKQVRASNWKNVVAWDYTCDHITILSYAVVIGTR